MVPIPRHPLVDELEKQYEVETVVLDAPVTKDMFDALIAVQPSSLSPDEFKRLVAAVEAGIPTAIFEDPVSRFRTDIPGTGNPRLTPGVPQMGGGRLIPKGEIRDLWEVLEITSPGQAGQNDLYFPDLILQDYNPYPNIPADAFNVFIDQGAPGVDEKGALSKASPITSGIRQVLTLFAAAIEKVEVEDSKLKHTELLRTGKAGRLSLQRLQKIQAGQSQVATEIQNSKPGYCLAMAIETQQTGSDKESKVEEKDSDGIKAVYVADVDIMLPDFLQLRAQPDQMDDMRFQFQNVTFILNVFDWLTGETEFIDVRNHQPIFATLRMIDSVKEEETSLVRLKTREFQAAYDTVTRDAREEMDKSLQPLKEEIEKAEKDSAAGKIPQADVGVKMIEYRTKESRLQRALNVKQQKEARERERRIREIERSANQQVTAIQNRVKATAVLLPCIPPLVVGVVVFASRRLRERENISKSRLK